MAILAAFLFGESISVVGAAGLVLGVVGLALLEVLNNTSYSLIALELAYCLFRLVLFC